MPSGITFAGDAWPDGRRLALERVRIGPGASLGPQLSILDSARHEIELVGTSGAFSVLVHRGVDPAWGPTGIAYTRPRGDDGDLKVITPDGTGASQDLPGTYARISGVKRDGSAMLVLTRDGGAGSVSLAGGQVTPLVAPGGAKGVVESVAWSR